MSIKTRAVGFLFGVLLLLGFIAALWLVGLIFSFAIEHKEQGAGIAALALIFGLCGMCLWGANE